MKPNPSSARFILAGLVGIGIGVGIQAVWLVTPSDEVSLTESARQASGSGTVARPLGPSETTIALRKVAAMSAGDCEARVRELCDQQLVNEIELEGVLTRWLELEGAEKVYQFINDSQNGIRRVWSQPFFRAWVAVDESAAMGTEEFAFRTDQALHAIENAYPDFSRFLKQTPGALQEGSGCVPALELLGRTDPLLGTRIVETISPGDPKLGYFLIGWASTDPKAALAWLDELAKTDTVARANYEAVFRVWALADPESARAAYEAISLPDSDRRQSAPRSVRNLPLPDRASTMDLALARNPFLTVLELHQQLTKSVNDEERPPFPQPAINHDGWYPPDSSAAFAEAAALPAGPARDFLMECLLNNLHYQDRDEARRLAELHGIESSLLMAMADESTSELRATAQSDPDAAFASFFDGNAAPLEGLTWPTAEKMIEEWAQTSPVEAANWLIEHPPVFEDANERQASLSNNLFDNAIGYHWAQYDPASAIDWMENLSDDTDRQRAWSAMSHYVSTYAPEVAFTIALDLYEPGPDRLARLHAPLFETSRSIGLPAAEALLNAPELTPEERSALAARLESAQP